MSPSILTSILAHYHWELSLYAGLGIVAVNLIGKYALMLVPTIRSAGKLNHDAAQTRLAKPSYAGNQKRNKLWSLLFMAVIFGLILPFCLTLKPTPWWRMIVDVVVILMVYDFFYYLTHRFLFHTGGVFGGPLVWMHAWHHQQLNPCRMDSSYLHPLEQAIGLGLYVATIVMLSAVMGGFHVVTLVVTFTAFSQINLHNHDLWESDRFPFRYLNYASEMHHHHHARFTGGNFATITVLYDWMFGTLDNGQGYAKPAKVQPSRT